MGARFDFKCEGCGYKAEVSGGRDCGMFAVVRTSTCADCRELVDVLVGHCGVDKSVGDPDYDRNLGRCPRCRGVNVVAWSETQPCPRCGQQMTQGGMTLLWD